ncbi:hypothetical protein ACFSRY_11085 [Pontibacter locisalis]|uniref:Uncharacterized protein n=1 Tax=Pontibacter locisalis TaxID=1719035 RepID=A0ABW5IN81_9BACT
MKIVVLLFASLFGFGVVSQQALSVNAPEKGISKTVYVEEPVMDVMLDTVEITVYAPVAVAVK